MLETHSIIEQSLMPTAVMLMGVMMLERMRHGCVDDEVAPMCSCNDGKVITASGPRIVAWALKRTA